MDGSTPETVSDRRSLPQSQSFARRASSVLKRAGKSFHRSGGKRGATIDNIRGTTGADFEHMGSVQRTSHESCFGLFGKGSKEGNSVVLIKGANCFVFKNAKAPAPKYAISLANLTAQIVRQDSKSVTISLETQLGDEEYTFTFPINDSSNNNVGESFVGAVSQQAAAAHTAMVRKRLGHEKMLTKGRSEMFADSIARKKVNEQPDKPIAASEFISNIPVAAL